MSEMIVIRRELCANAVESISAIYAAQLADVQTVQDGDGKILKAIHWGAMAPRSTPSTAGYLPQWSHQDVELEVRASVDYFDRTLDARYLTLIQVLEDFFARPDLMARLSSANVVVQSPPTFDIIEEAIENGSYVTTYRLRVSARGRAEGETL